MNSLLDLPGLTTLMAMDDRLIVERPCSSQWTHHLDLRAGSGWNPYTGQLYLPQDSVALSYLRDPSLDARALNRHDDRLVRSIFGVAHDFLHLVATAWIMSLAPLRLFDEPLSHDTLEDHVFLLLVAEAVAVIGLDYWYLSAQEPRILLELGSRQRGYAVSYHLRDHAEYSRHSAGWSTETPLFFELLVDFYTSGSFRGFAVQHVATSPKLHDWLSHELQYAHTQRVHARAWLSHMLEVGEIGDPGMPVQNDRPWMRNLIRQVGERLWCWIRGGQPLEFRPYALPVAFQSVRSRPDKAWKFANAGAFSKEEWLDGAGPAESLLIDQLIQLTPFPRDRDAVRAVKEARGRLTHGAMVWLLISLGLDTHAVESEAALFFPR
jgi:hypothetical protein